MLRRMNAKSDAIGIEPWISLSEPGPHWAHCGKSSHRNDLLSGVATTQCERGSRGCSCRTGGSGSGPSCLDSKIFRPELRPRDGCGSREVQVPYRRIRFGPSRVDLKICSGTRSTLSSWYFGESIKKPYIRNDRFWIC
ncbi:uncharacterized protein LOC105187048 [Harpegnathos saltator]|uniref:uncharacterized protein LOC105187048 n=1 Tax=Harpegnathos saltator TaxID=610380 RepID=UPI000DBEE8D9|nr:uncharacterized protein LOC105187048 [Harpegnathos saltator]